MYHAEHTHEAIISMEIFQAVQAEKARRAERFLKKPATKVPYPYTSILCCANCGKKYHRKITATGPVWICDTFNSLGKAACASKQIPENILNAVTAEVIGSTEFTTATLRRQIDHIDVHKGNTLIYNFVDGKQATRTWKDRSRSESWTPEKREAARKRRLEQKEK